MNVRQGMTLIEMLVVCTLLLLLGGIVSLALRPGMLAWRRSEVKSDLQGNALLVLHALTHALREASSNNVTIYPHQGTEGGQDTRTDALAVLSPYDAQAQLKTADGHAVMQSMVVYFVKPGDAQLWETTMRLTSTETDKPTGELLPPIVVQSLENGLGVPSDVGVQRCIGRDVRQVSINNPGGVFTVMVETAREDYTCRLESAITPTIESLSGGPTR